MTLIQTILAFFVVICALIMIHELGHYWAARWCGVKVLRFSLGMGKAVFSRRFGKDQTEWVVSALPIGGYVKMLDAREQDVSLLPEADRRREFTAQSVYKRIVIVAATLANFILAILLYTGLNIHGFPEPSARLRAMAESSAAWQAGLRGGDIVTSINGAPVRGWSDFRWNLVQDMVNHQAVDLQVQDRAGQVRDVVLPLNAVSLRDLDGDFMGKLGLDVARTQALIGVVAPDGAAQQAGLRQGDEVLAVNGKPVLDGLDFVQKVRASPGVLMNLEVLRAGQRIQLRLTPTVQDEGGMVVGKVRAEVASMPEMVHVSYSPVQAFVGAFSKTWETSVLSVKMLGKMITGEVSLKNITGPVTIADYAGQTARMGIISFLSFMAFVSVSLGVMNLLPVPILDGGLLLYYAFEVVSGRRVSGRADEIGQRLGVGVLMMFMVVAIFNDIVRLLS